MGKLVLIYTLLRKKKLNWLEMELKVDFRIVFEGAQNITTDKKWHASEFNKRIQNNVVCIQFDQKLLTCIQAL